MITVSTISYNLGQSYYTSAEDSEKQGVWLGLLAQSLNLPQEIQPKHYLNLLAGCSPFDENQFLLGRRVKSDNKKSATDFTFSAPKSVSLQTLLLDDAQARLAHWLAVQVAIAHSEKFAQSRGYEGEYGGNRYRVKVDTSNLIVACFQHIESRPTQINKDVVGSEDPHLHTHCLVMNLTHLPNGKWRSLDTWQIIHHLNEIKQLYYDSLRTNLLEFGFPLREDKKWPEIATWDDDAIALFSTRRNTIKKFATEHNHSESSAWLKTRGTKRSLSPDDLSWIWQERWRIFREKQAVAQKSPKSLQKLDLDWELG